MSAPPLPLPPAVASEVFVRRSKVAAPAAAVFRWHARTGALERLTPPWERMRVIHREGGIDGGRVVMRMGGPIPVRWVAEHRDYREDEQFRDVQVQGPFARFEHTHRMIAAGPAESYLEDRIEYVLPLGALGALCGGAFARQRLARTFAYRHRVTAQDIAAHGRAGGQQMKILVTGSSGLIGSALVPFLSTGGHQVTRLVRAGGTDHDAATWDPAQGTIDREALEGLDAVVHLAGENIAGRWTTEKKARIYASRVDGTRVLVDALTSLRHPPRTLVAASAIGYYGDRDADIVDEDSAPGNGFLADVVREWEAATQPAAQAGIRVVNLRFGVVLSGAGGALASMLPPFRFGLGGPVGTGWQYMSWVALDDAIGAVLHGLATPALSGPVNVVAPLAVTNRDFTTILARVLSRPAVVPLPAFAVKLAFGEMGEALLLSSTRVDPERLKATQYAFRFPELEGALRHLLGR